MHELFYERRHSFAKPLNVFRFLVLIPSSKGDGSQQQCNTTKVEFLLFKKYSFILLINKLPRLLKVSVHAINYNNLQ